MTMTQELSSTCLPSNDITHSPSYDAVPLAVKQQIHSYHYHLLAKDVVHNNSSASRTRAVQTYSVNAFCPEFARSVKWKFGTCYLRVRDEKWMLLGSVEY